MTSAGRFAIRTGGALLLVCLALAPERSALAQFSGRGGAKKEPKSEADKAQNFVVGVYPIDDLVVVVNDYPFRVELPTTTPLKGREFRPGAGRGMGLGGAGGGMGGGGMGGGGMGGGMFSVPESGASSSASSATSAITGSVAVSPMPRIEPAARRGNTVRSLMNLITQTVDGDWNDGEGGNENKLVYFGGNLVVRHTAEGQRNVENLLSALRRQSSNARSVHVDATWILLGPADRDSLQKTANPNKAAKGVVTLDAKRFRDFSARATAIHGQITCLDGQQVHLATGRRRLISTGAQASVGVGAVGYTAHVDVVNIGAVLQVTPKVMAITNPDHLSAIVDLQSVVTQWGDPSPPIQVKSHSLTPSGEKSLSAPLIVDSATIDRANLVTQEWSTTVSMPVGVPVLVGSITLSDADGKGDKLSAGDHSELALVIEVRAD